jgi:hypothetical protein
MERAIEQVPLSNFDFSREQFAEPDSSPYFAEENRSQRNFAKT